jgi:Na+/H+ antiporter NhaD/arsenite permease-like protein
MNHSPLRRAWPALARLSVLFMFAPSVSFAASSISGTELSLWWGVPFVGILLSIALLPLLATRFWHRHYGKVAAVWALAFALPFAVNHGAVTAIELLAHTLLLEYVPFIILLAALFTVSGGIRLTGNLHGSPATNTALLGVGTLLASVVGTTGAAMLLIRPLLRANDNRRRNVHTVIFFIFLVANIGGSLTPLGDPPLFLGFLKGVDFFWTTTHLLAPMAFVSSALLLIFYFLDRYFYATEADLARRRDPTPDSRLGIQGKRNLILLAGIVGMVLLSGIWKSQISFEILGTRVELQNLVRDASLIAIAALSFFGTSDRVHEANRFNWAPILEVGKLFAGIFFTIIPVIAILHAGKNGALAGVVDVVTADNGQPINALYFWLTGTLSAFLDNAPTYLVFFNLASGDARELTGPLSATLTAISAGAVFMGAMTYIGNAPNFMVKAMAEERGISMPGFFRYMAWSCAILLPLFALTTLLFFR